MEFNSAFKGLNKDIDPRVILKGAWVMFMLTEIILIACCCYFANSLHRGGPLLLLRSQKRFYRSDYRQGNYMWKIMYLKKKKLLHIIPSDSTRHPVLLNTFGAASRIEPSRVESSLTDQGVLARVKWQLHTGSHWTEAVWLSYAGIPCKINECALCSVLDSHIRLQLRWGRLGSTRLRYCAAFAKPNRYFLM